MSDFFSDAFAKWDTTNAHLKGILDKLTLMADWRANRIPGAPSRSDTGFSEPGTFPVGQSVALPAGHFTADAGPLPVVGAEVPVGTVTGPDGSVQPLPAGQHDGNVVASASSKPVTDTRGIPLTMSEAATVRIKK